MIIFLFGVKGVNIYVLKKKAFVKTKDLNSLFIFFPYNQEMYRDDGKTIRVVKIKELWS